MAEPSDEVFDAIAEVLPPCLDTLERIAWVQRHLYPPVAVRLSEALGPQRAALEAPLAALERAACPPELAFMRDRLVTVARETAEIVGAFVEAAAAPDDVIGLYRA